MFFEEIYVFLVCVLPHVLATSCMPKCGIPSEWLTVARNVCYGTKDDNFGNFTVDRNCELFAMRFVHVSGFQNFEKEPSRWGYTSDYPIGICTLLLKNRKLLIPRKLEYEHIGFLGIDDGYIGSRIGYHFLDGFDVDDDVIVLKQNETLIKGQELEIAFCLDFIDKYESLNEGTHCVDVDVSCYV